MGTTVKAVGNLFSGGGDGGATEQSNQIIQQQLDETKRQRNIQSKKLYAESLSMLRNAGSARYDPDLPVAQKADSSSPRLPFGLLPGLSPPSNGQKSILPFGFITPKSSPRTPLPPNSEPSLL
jgi:hypothetical protein